MKITTFNIEWMVYLFKANQAGFWSKESRSTGLGSKPKDVPALCARIAAVIRDMDSDIVGIQEGPPRKDQMELFVQEYLHGAYDVYTIPDGRQSNHALVRRDTVDAVVTQLPETHRIYQHLSRPLTYYTWGEIRVARMEKFTRKPVALDLKLANGSNIELAVVHTKSKISQLKTSSQWVSGNRDAVVDALRSRQKLSAEIAALRRYVTHGILSRRTCGMILLGDFNDGPKRDVFEEHFLIQTIIDELRASFRREAALLHHALPQQQLVGAKAYTARFRDPTHEGKDTRVMLDHILVTTGISAGDAGMRVLAADGRIEHEIFDRQVQGRGNERHQRPSDHRPVSIFCEIC